MFHREQELDENGNPVERKGLFNGRLKKFRPKLRPPRLFKNMKSAFKKARGNMKKLRRRFRHKE
jgi:hypothetical protein